MTQKKKKRTPVKELLASWNPTHGSWIELLSEEDHQYVIDVAEEARENSSAPANHIARMLIKELGIKRSVEVVARTLRELIR